MISDKLLKLQEPLKILNGKLHFFKNKIFKMLNLFTIRISLIIPIGVLKKLFCDDVILVILIDCVKAIIGYLTCKLF